MASKAAKKSSKKTSTKKTSGKNSKARLLLAIFALIIIGLGLIIYLISSDTIIYKDLKVVQSSDNRFQVKVPEQMDEVQAGRSTVDYEHRQHDETKGIIGHVRVEAQYLGADNISETKKIIKEQLKNKKGEYYDVFKKKANGGPLAQNLVFGSFYDYKSTNIGDGLVSDFFYSFEKTEVKGKLLIAFDQDSMYFLVAESTDKVWENNKIVWEEVLASFKVK